MKWLVAILGSMFIFGCVAPGPLAPPIDTDTFVSPFPGKIHKNLQLFELKDPEVIGVTSTGQKIYLGGLSSLSYLKRAGDDLYFEAITDRGANAQEFGNFIGVGRLARPILLPNFSPAVLLLKVNEKTMAFSIVESAPFFAKKGMKMSGLPPKNPKEYKKNEIPMFELPIDVKGNKLSPTEYGMDSEGYCKINENHFVSEEYGPDLLMFDKNRVLKKRWRPGRGLPKILSTRKTNRGGEGLACGEKYVYFLMQSPLKNELPEDVLHIRLVKFDPNTEKAIKEYFYPIEAGVADKLGDLTRIDGERFLIIEQNGKRGTVLGNRKIYEVDLSQADEKGRLQKKLIVDLNKLGLDFVEKIEGVAVVDRNKIAVSVDNDFGIDGLLDLNSGLVPTKDNDKTYLGIITLDNNLY